MFSFLRQAIFPASLLFYSMSRLFHSLGIQKKDFLFHAIARLFAAQFGVREIRAAQLMQRVKAGNPTLIFDVRTPEEQSVSTLRNAICVHTKTDLTQTFEYQSFSRKHSNNSDALIITYCGGGYRGSQAIDRFLKQQPIPALNLHGGIVDYANAGGSLVEPISQNPTRRVHGYSETWAGFVKAPNEGVFK